MQRGNPEMQRRCQEVIDRCWALGPMPTPSSRSTTERYALAIGPERLAEFGALCRRERCPFAVLGEASDDGRLLVTDAHFGNAAIDLPLDVVLGRPPRMVRDVKRERVARAPLDLAGVTIADGRAARAGIRHHRRQAGPDGQRGRGQAPGAAHGAQCVEPGANTGSDAADALALAICHASAGRLAELGVPSRGASRGAARRSWDVRRAR